MAVKASKRTIGYAIVGLALMAFLTSGEGLWQGLAVAAIAISLGAIEQFVHRRRTRRDVRVRTQLSREDRNCRSCGADLWGLDVKPGTSGKYRIKCSECGVLNEFKPGKLKKQPKPAKRQWDEADTRSFKIR